MNASDFRDEELHMLKAESHHPSAPGQRPPFHAVGPEPRLDGLSLAELRDLRRRAQQDEADLSYLRRMLQGRIDILRAELARRTGQPRPAESTEVHGSATSPEATPPGTPAAIPEAGGETSPDALIAAQASPAVANLLDRLPEILADGPSRVRTSARHVTLGTPRSEEYRRLAEEVLGNVELSALDARTDEELGEAMRCLVGHEEEVSERRQRLQRTADGCSAEIARRYREGEARVEDLLAGG